jgi:hypothetical protein
LRLRPRFGTWLRLRLWTGFRSRLRLCRRFEARLRLRRLLRPGFDARLRLGRDAGPRYRAALRPALELRCRRLPCVIEAALRGRRMRLRPGRGAMRRIARAGPRS